MVDTNLEGHHIAYLNEIIHGCDAKFTLVLPEKSQIFQDQRVITYHKVDLVNKRFVSFLFWMKEIAEIADKENPDIVHFLNGDIFYKYFGLGLKYFKKYKTIVTLHWIRPGKIQHFSLLVFAKKVSTVVVHSTYLLEELHSLGIQNGVHIEYPQFKRLTSISSNAAKQYWHLDCNKPVILALGGTRKDKGVDILVDALGKVNAPFSLLIAGKPEEFDDAYVQEHTKKYAHQVTTALRYLTDKEVEMAVAAADIVVLPYRFSFNGASGPLGEGVCRKKCIIGSAHGNLGDTIRRNHLGYTFETENADFLAIVLNKALTQIFIPDKKYFAYKDSLDPKGFVKRYSALYKKYASNKLQ